MAKGARKRRAWRHKEWIGGTWMAPETGGKTRIGPWPFPRGNRCSPDSCRAGGSTVRLIWASAADRSKTFQHIDRVDTHLGHRVAALEHEDRGQAGARQVFAHAQVVAALEAEARDRVAFESVDAERHDQRPRAHRGEAAERRLQRRAPR